MFSVVIPTYNEKELLEKSINSILESKGDLVEEIIVVDNGSMDGTRDLVQNYNSKFKIRLIRNSRNLGFARAVNQGIQAAKKEHVVVMNNDLKLDNKWFEITNESIKRTGSKDKVASWFGKVLNYDGKKIESTGLIYWLKGKAFNRGNGKDNDPDKYAREEYIFGPSASIAVYKKSALMKVGLFDEDFFAYEEDVDLAIRLFNNGWKTRYLPGAISYHLGGATSKKMGNLRRRMDSKNWWYIIIKNYPLSVLIKNGPEIIVERLRNLSGLFKAIPLYRWPQEFIKTYGEILIRLPAMLKKRKPIAASQLHKLSKQYE